MGAVGLNFGSATSGQGFDVTSTVNQIVTNLQSVETPWKTQLASLQSRDMALSSLGTQLSTLTTDLQSLTDFQGVLTGKTGSSSDTNVLELMSASSTAVAGTHAISILNLAQTSSAASDAVGASDTLSGGITFKVGEGEWQTVNVGDHGTATTLSGLSAAINAAGLGVQASVMTNADGTVRLSLVSKTHGAAGEITIANAGNHPSSATTLADSTNAGANAGLGLSVIQDGIDATLKVDGVTVTSASNTVTDAIQGVTFQLLSAGTLNPDGTVRSVQVVVANDTASVETAITSLVNDYNTVVKALNGQEGKDSSGNPEPLYGIGVLAQVQQGLLSAISASFGTNTINSLISLGIKATAAADGTIAVDADKLASVLNSNFDQVVSLFQDTGGFGAKFMKTLEGIGSNSGTGGAVALVLKEDGAEEKALNDDISAQEALIAAQKTRLTAELNLANQILQSIPEQINQVNEMYSAITGYKQNN